MTGAKAVRIIASLFGIECLPGVSPRIIVGPDLRDIKKPGKSGLKADTRLSVGTNLGFPFEVLRQNVVDAIRVDGGLVWRGTSSPERMPSLARHYRQNTLAIHDVRLFRHHSKSHCYILWSVATPRSICSVFNKPEEAKKCAAPQHRMHGGPASKNPSEPHQPTQGALWT